MSNTITLKVKDKAKFNRLLSLINDLDYVEVVKKDQAKKEKATAGDDFFALAGMWKNRNITQSELRSRAWPRTK